MRNTKRIKADPKLPIEARDHLRHAPLQDDHTRTSAKEEHKTDEADIRKFTSNSDNYDVLGDEYNDDEHDYLK